MLGRERRSPPLAPPPHPAPGVPGPPGPAPRAQRPLGDPPAHREGPGGAQHPPQDRAPALPQDQAPGPHRPAPLRPQGHRGRGGLRQSRRDAPRGRHGARRALRQGDRARLQRLPLLPPGVRHGPSGGPAPLPRAAGLLGRGGPGANREGRDGGLRHEPPQQHGLHHRGVPRRGPSCPQLRRGRVGEDLAPARPRALAGGVLRAAGLAGRPLPARPRALHRHGHGGGRHAGALPRGRPEQGRQPCASPSSACSTTCSGSSTPRGARDLVFVPVGINYDRTLEDRTLLLGLEPGAPQKGREGKGRGQGRGRPRRS